MKSCPEVYEFLCDNLGQEVDSPECREIQRHLNSCENCRHSLEELRETVKLFRAAPAPAVSSATHHRLLEALRVVQHGAGPSSSRAARGRVATRGGRRTRKRRTGIR
jgi:anti-sigma factor RsiW